MNPEIPRLHESRQKVWHEMKEISARAAEADLSAEDEGAWQTANDALNKIDERLSLLIDADKRTADLDAAVAPYGAPAEPVVDQNDTERLRALARGEVRSVEFTRDAESRVQTVGAPTAGGGGYAGTCGNTVPTSFYDRLIAHLIEVSGVMQAAPTVLNTSSGESLQIPKTTAHSTAAIVAEAGTIGTNEPTFGQLTLGAFKYGDLMQVSRELVTDTGVDLEGYLSMQVGRALGNALGAHLLTGTGTGQPRGILTDSTLGVTGGAGVSGAFTADNMIDLHYSVIAPYRASQSCYWITKDSSLATIRKFKDTTNQYIWQPSLVAGAPDMVLGKPIVTDPFVPAVALSAKSLVFGDFSQYFVRMVGGGIRFEQSSDFAFNTDLITYRAILRADAALVDLTGAVKHFVGNAA